MDRTEFEKYAADLMESRIFRRVARAREFHEGTWTDENYYRRHLLETVLRIDLNNEVDAYCLYKLGSSNNGLASLLSRYLAEEYGHDGMFLRDLARFGMSEEEARSTRVFPSTEKLIGYMYHVINQDGPLATMVWNWFVEWYSDSYNGVITDAAAAAFGDTRVRGSRQHLAVDEDEDHLSLMFSTIESLVHDADQEERAKVYLRTFVDLIGEYFDELQQETVPALVSA